MENETFDSKNLKNLKIKINYPKEEQAFIKTNINKCTCKNNESFDNFFKNKIISDLKNENIENINFDNERKNFETHYSESSIENKNNDEKKNIQEIKNKNIDINLNGCTEAKKDPSELLEDERFRDKLVEKYVASIKPIRIEKEFEFLQDENLHQILEKIRNSSIDKYQKDNLMSFLFLGDFLNEKDNKYFEVYFRKPSEYVELIDFLVYDITKIKEAEEMEINLKSKFFAKIAHEFKTPLNSIIGLIKKMNTLFKEKNFKDSEINFTLKQIENLSSYVILLINDIIQSSNIYSSNKSGIWKAYNGSINGKSNSGNNLIKKPKLKIEEINLKEITIFCKEVLHTLLLSKEKEKYVSIKYSFDKEIEKCKLLSDEFRLKQMLLNLISNSVKFTKSGSIAIKSQLMKEEENNHNYNNKNNSQEYVKISIMDTGIGMDEKELKYLQKFKDTNLLEGGMNYNQDGNGLGIGITKYFADQLNHKLEIESFYSKGSCFSIILKAEAKEKEAENINSSIYNKLALEKEIFPTESNKKISSKIFKKQSILFDKQLNDNFVEEESKVEIDINNIRFKKIYQNENDNICSKLLKKIKNKKQQKRNFSSKLRTHSYKTPSNLIKKVEEEWLFYKTSTKEVTMSEKIGRRKIKVSPKCLKFKTKLDSNFNSMWNEEDYKNIQKCDPNIFPFKFSKFKKSKNKNLEENENFLNESLDNITEKYSKIFANPYKLDNLYFDDEEGRIKINKDFSKNFFQDKTNTNGIKNGHISDADSQISCDLKLFNGKLISDLNEKKINFIDFSNLGDSPCLYSIKNNKNKSKNNRKILEESCSKQDNKDKKVILLVDDHLYVREAVRNIINNILKKRDLLHKFIVIEEQDGVDILKEVIQDQFKNNRISCIITDENMEFMNGSEAIKIIKNFEKNKKIKQIKIASITAYEDELTRNHIKNAGVDYFIPKPCSEMAMLGFFKEFNILDYKDVDKYN